MRKFFTGLAASIIFSAVVAQEQVLTLNLEQGEEYKQATDSRVTVSQDLNGQKIDITMTLKGQMTFMVLSVSADGYDLNASYDKLGLSIEMPQGAMDFSSEKEDVNDVFSTILKGMKGKLFKVTIAKNGKVLHVGSLENLWGGLFDQFPQIPEEQLQKFEAQIKNAYGEKAFKGSIEMCTAIFPDKPVRKGDKWTIKTNLESGMAAMMTTEYQFVEITSNYTLIKGVSIIETADKESYVEVNGRPARYNLKGSMISEIKIDPVTGWTIEAKIDQDIRGDVYVKDKENEIRIPMVMNNKMTITN
jgi:hypothetical protein